MTTRHRRDLDVACTLGETALTTRVEEWRQLRRDDGLGAEPIEGGGRLVLRRRARVRVSELVAAEAGCCSFLTFSLEEGADRLVLDVTSSAEDALPVIATLTGAALPSP